MNWVKKLFIVSIIMAFVFLPSHIFSQSVTETNALFFKLDPGNPKANSAVTVTLNSYSIDLNTPTISWNYNGKDIGSGVGYRSISIIAGANSSSTKLTATVYSGLTTTYSATTYIEPGDIDLLWQAVDSYAPPFYKGKRLPADESTIKVVAISDILGTKGASYTWTRNGSSVASVANSANKNYFAFTHNELNNSENIGVQAYGGGNTQSESNSVTITPINPSIITYQKLNGFIDYASGYTKDFFLNTSGTTLHLEPFFFSTYNNFDNDLSFNTTIDGIKPDTLQINEVPIIKPSSSGDTTLYTKIESIKKDWQNAEQSLVIHF